ncbi:MAG: BACON domain-containing carbohydrate-binding protein [Melioribacteraceae bacterium]
MLFKKNISLSILSKIIFLLFAYNFSILSQPANYVKKQGGICFRTDDDQPIARYTEYASLFNNYNQKFTFAINLGTEVITPEYITMLKNLQSHGHEMMDHTPVHKTNYFFTKLSTDLYKNHPGVHKIDGNKIELNHIEVDNEYAVKYSKRSGYVNVNGDIVTSLSGEFSAFAKTDCYLYFPTINKLVLINDYVGGWIDSKTVAVRDIWDNTVNLGNYQNILYYNFDVNNIHITVEGLKVLTQESLRLVNYYGLERPYTWIQPGGYFPHVYRNELKQACGSELGYKAGGVFADPSLKVFNEYNPENDKQFGMDFSDIRDDIWSLNQCKEFIADRIAKHRVIFGGNHFSWTELLGGWDGFLQRTEGIIQWCIEKDIPIRTYNQWADILYNQTSNPNENIFPDLNDDNDGNNYPDGYYNNYRTTDGLVTLESNWVKNDGVKESDYHSFQINKAGKICYVGRKNWWDIDGLAGLEKGENDFEIWTKGAKGDFIEVDFKIGNNHSVLKFSAESNSWTKYNISQSINGNTSLFIPAYISLIEVTISCSQYSSGNVCISGMNLAKTLTQTNYLTVDPANLSLPSSNGMIEISINSNTNWHVDEHIDWLTISPTQGNNDQIITLLYDENYNVFPKDESFTITDGNLTSTVYVHQAEKKYLEIYPGQIELSRDSNSVELTIYSNTNWQVNENIDWLTISPTQGNNDQIITLLYDENYNVFPRDESFTITDGNLTSTVYVHQAEKKYLEINPNQIELSSDSNSVELTIYSNTNWQIDEDVDWFSFSSTIDTNDARITLYAVSNPNIVERSATFLLYSENLTLTVIVKQNPKKYCNIQPSFKEFPSDSSFFNFVINSNIDWQVSKSNDWFIINKTSGFGNDTLTVNLSKNFAEENRIGKIFINGNDLSDTLVINQTGSKYFKIFAIVDSTVGGIVEGVGKYISGSIITLSAKSNLGWRFKGWVEDSLLVSTDSIYSFEAKFDRILIAKFSKILTDINNEELVSNEFYLYQNYPNPFNPTTTLKYSIPYFDQNGSLSNNVTLKIYDVLGKEIKTLVNKHMQPGIYEVTFNAQNIPSGIYYYVLSNGKINLTNRMVLIK